MSVIQILAELTLVVVDLVADAVHAERRRQRAASTDQLRRRRRPNGVPSSTGR
jgi:hypothetical protein